MSAGTHRPILAGNDPRPPGPIALVDARVIDGSGNDPVDGEVVVIEGDEITFVGPRGDVALSRMHTISLAGQTLLPGLINCHGHLTHSELEVRRPLPASRATEVELALQALSRARECLHHGVTTLRDCGARGEGIFAARAAIGSNATLGCRIYAAGKVICVSGGHMHAEGRQADGPDDWAEAVREQIRAGADFVKVKAEGGTGDGALEIRRPAVTREELLSAVEAAHRLGTKISAHALTAPVVRLATECGVDAIEHGREIDPRTAELMAQNGTIYVPTLQGMERILRFGPQHGLDPTFASRVGVGWEMARRSIPIAVHAGVTIVAGSDGGGPYNPNHEMVRGLELLMELGMTSDQAIRAATSNAARLLGEESRLGAIQRGKLADLIAVPGDPLRDLSLLSSPSFVMKQGSIILNTARPH